MSAPVAVIGGGLTGLTAAIRLAEQGVNVHLLEMAPQPGGRTRSFLEPKLDIWVDNGPHLLIGAYQATRQLFKDASADSGMTFQSSLSLPLWDEQRGHFALEPAAWLPFPIAMLTALVKLPGHNSSSLLAMLRIAQHQSEKNASPTETVSAWMRRLDIPAQLEHDFLEPLCLGAMNDAPDLANANSFKEVLKTAFATHKSARLGWFNQPLQQAMIEPLMAYAEQLGVQITTACRVSRIADTSDGNFTLDTQSNGQRHSHNFQRIVLAVPPNTRGQLISQSETQPLQVRSQPITNIHLWFKERINLPEPLIGCLQGYGQWFFDISAQHQSLHPYSHICAIISADQTTYSKAEKVELVLEQLRQLMDIPSLQAFHYRVVTVKSATYQVQQHNFVELPAGMIDACENPAPGEFPATIEAAVLRGEQAARDIIQSF